MRCGGPTEREKQVTDLHPRAPGEYYSSKGRVLLFKPLLSAYPVNTRDRKMGILELVGKVTLESGLSLSSQLHYMAMWKICWSSLFKHSLGTV